MSFVASVVRRVCVGIQVQPPFKTVTDTFILEILKAACRVLPLKGFNDYSFYASIDDIIKVNTFLPIRNVNNFHLSFFLSSTIILCYD